jgi:hypothetical protein
VTSSFYLADASALERMPKLIREDALPEFWPAMTKAVENAQLRFPREVVDELNVTARLEQVAAWASGLGTHLNDFRGNIRYSRPLMAHVANCGFEEGFEDLDGKEPAAAGVGRLACQYSEGGATFWVATEDIGELPLRPTMVQICLQAGWGIVDAESCLRGLGLAALLL